MESSSTASLRVLMLPWLAHGHISPFLELAKKFTKRNFYIYLCSTPINLSSIKNRLSDKYSLSIQLVELHLPSVPNLLPHQHTTNGLPAHLMSTLKAAHDMAAPSFLAILQTLKPDLVIYDHNQVWAPTSASSLKIPAVQFLTSGAITLSFAFHAIKFQNEPHPFPEIYFRGLESLKPRRGSPASSSIDPKDKDRFLGAVEQSCGVTLVKSFREIEAKYIDHVSLLSGKKFLPVGPLVQEPIEEDGDHGHREILQWLDKKEASSVVFVSFGSEYFLSKEDMEEVGHGLELSKANFIWVVRFPVGEKVRVEEELPDGFSERVGDRGLVVEGWAPQTKVLEHPSTGGFVTHCGWSSIMESMEFGVPIIAMPMHLDQPLNARLVEEVGVGVEVKRDQDWGVRREDIAQVIRQVMVETSGESVRVKAREFSERLRMKGDEEIDGVVEELVRLCKERKQ